MEAGWGEEVGRNVLRSPHFRFFYPRAEQPTAEALRDWLEAQYPAATRTLGAEPGKRIDVYLFATYEAFEQATGGDLDPWVIGLAQPARWSMYLPPQDSLGEAKVVAWHELAHVLFDQTAGVGRVPRWLTEGVAKYLSRDFTLADRQRLEQTAREFSWLPLAALEEDFPHDPERAHLAYAESYTFVAFLIDRFGPDALARLSARLRAGEALPEAVETAFAVKLAAMQEEWFTYLRDKYRRQALFGSTDLLMFTAITLLFFLAVGRRWRQRRTADEPDRSEGAGETAEP
jgi:hypothetical protein